MIYYNYKMKGELDMQIGFSGLLTLIFVICKLIGIIEWSWWVVFLPLPIAFALVFILTLIIALLER